MSLELASVKIGIYDGSAEGFFLEYPLNVKLNRSVRSAMATMSFAVSTSNYGMQPDYVDMNLDAVEAKELLIPGTMVSLYVNDRKQFTGYITRISYTGSHLSIEAKDIIWRLENTQMNYMRKALNPNSKVDAIMKYALESLKQLDNKGFPTEFDDGDWMAAVTIYYTQASSLSKLTGKPPDTDLVSDTESIKDEDIKPKENESVYAFLSRLLKPWGYMLQATADGNLVIFRPNVNDGPRHLFVSDRTGNKQYGSNAAPMSGLPSLNYDISGMHSFFFVFNNTVAKDSPAKRIGHQIPMENYEGPRCNSVTYDKDLKTNAACEKTAKRIAAKELSSGWQYEFEIAGFVLDGIVFSNDIVVTIQDEHIGVSSDLYVIAVELTMDENSRQTAKFTCTQTAALILE